MNESFPIDRVMIIFSLMVVVSVLWAFVLFSDRAQMTPEKALAGTLVVEVIDTLLVLVGLAIVGRSSLPAVSPGIRPLAWGMAVPTFSLLFGANLLYGALIREWLRIGGVNPAPPITPILLLLVCLQPALIEELFFRYVAFGVLYRAMGPHSAVLVTAVMFSVAHIYNPLGMPYLFVAGVVFGYARLWGGLALPMVMHFCHNLAVLAVGGV